MSEWLSDLVANVHVDPMVPPGAVELRDEDGIVARVQVFPPRADSVGASQGSSGVNE